MSNQLTAVWQLMRGHRLKYGAAIGSLVVASCFLYLAPLVPQATLDGVITRKDDVESARVVTLVVDLLGGREFVGANLWWPALVVLLVTLIAGVFTYLRGRWSAEASEAIIRSVRDRVFDHLQRLPCAYFDKAESGDLIQRCTSDVETLRLFLSSQVVEIGRAAIMLIVPIPLMLAIDVRMTIVSLVVVPVIVAFSLIYFVKIRDCFKEKDEAEGKMTAVIQENLTGIRVVRAFARQNFEKEKFADANGLHRDLDYRLYVLLARFWSISDFFCLMQKALIVGCGVYWMAEGTLQVGAFYFFLTAAMMFIWPVRMMGRILADLGKAVVALDRLLEILAEPLEASADIALSDPVAIEGRIAFDEVCFDHGSDTPVLDHVSFALQAGETLAIIGPSGCGKSTIVDLLLRLYDYDQGSIRIDDRELKTIPRAEIRAQTAVVMQQPFLFSRTLRENLEMGRPEAVEEEIIEATTVACVHDAIMGFEEGYETRVGERGVTLSGGQRQRVAIARALLQEPALLILDDALSAVDTRTETMILDALRTRHGRQTTIVIAHRLSTIQHADRVLVLEEGRVIQCGTHTQLIEAKGLYRRLWRLQEEDDSVLDNDPEEVGHGT